MCTVFVFVPHKNKSRSHGYKCSTLNPEKGLWIGVETSILGILSF